MKKIIILLFSFIFLAAALCTPAGAFKPDFEVSAEGVLLVNTDTGDVIFSKNTDKRLYPASLTKLMTATLLIENISDLENEVIIVSDRAVKSVLGTGLAVANFKEGEELTALQMLHFMLIPSSADACEAIADHIAGSDTAFVALMNERAAQLGMTGTHFANVHGLHHEEHYTTVDDMYKLVNHAFSLPYIRDICSMSRYSMPATNMSAARTLSTTNMLIDRSTNYYYQYASGVKTGYTTPAGRCLISTASRNGYNYLCIMMNCPPQNSAGYPVRYDFTETKALYEWVFSTFEYKSVTTVTKPVGEVKVELSSDTDFVSVVPKNDFMTMLPKSADSSTVTVEVELFNDTVEAPVEKGQIMGKARYYYAGEQIGEVEVVAAQSVERSQMLAFAKTIMNIFSSWAFRILLIVFVLAVIAFIIAVYFLNRKRRKRRGRYKGW